MRSRFLAVPLVAVVGLAVIFAVDGLSTVEGTSRGLLRAAAIVAAVIVAGVFYSRWGSVPHRTVPHHAMAALGLLGGALVASSAFGAGAGVFGNEITASIGLAALVLSLVAARATTVTTTPGESR